MLKNISWSDYMIFIFISFSVYYLLVGLKYFSGDIKDILSGKKKLRQRPLSSGIAGINDNTTETYKIKEPGLEDTTDDEFDEVEELIERIKIVIADASRRKLVAEEFKQYLGKILKEYHSLKYSALKSSIVELIVSECQKCGIKLNVNEVNLLWHEVEL